ncbi:metallo-beta-lactamase superfamily protein [Phaeosphaeria sp. MPI-PUGE-AT-0046c]|nr:metallo-beta-lactamase superfamily protein [Phaeosphaeria sp. MPI-PUGE-AT-0046c]
MEHARSPPDLCIAESKITVKIPIIDTTSHMSKFPASGFVDPMVPGFAEVDCCDFAFLIEHPTSTHKCSTLLFDLGVRKDWENSPATFVEGVKSAGCVIEVEKDVATILREHGQDLNKVGGIVWSHRHCVHVGDPNTSPSSTDVIVGPGFKSHHVPAYPTVPESHVDERAWEIRNGLKIGQFDAIDLYGDGSFYLLNTPGHTIGHMSALARTTVDPPTFIFMGGDHGGEFRPTEYMPLPDEIHPHPLKHALIRPPPTCPGDIFLPIHPKNSRTAPFFDTTPAEGGWHLCAAEATRSIEKMTEFDAYDNIFPVIAHDNTLMGVVDVYPKQANDWQNRGWKDTSRWGFLGDFDIGTKGMARAAGEDGMVRVDSTQA